MQLQPNFFPFLRKIAWSRTRVEEPNNNYQLEEVINFLFHRQPDYFQHSKFNWQYLSYSLDAIFFRNFQKTGQQNSRLSTTATEETTFLGNTIFHNIIPLYFSAQVASKQLQHKEYFTSSNATYFKSNQKLQTTAELTIFSSHIQQLNVEQITYWSYPIFEL